MAEDKTIHTQDEEPCEVDVDEELEALEYAVSERLAKAFLRSKITPLLIIAALFIGMVCVWFTPKEEEPQIVVPMVDILVPYPGANAHDVEKVVTAPMEKMMWEIPGVDYVYSASMNDVGVVTVRFNVGEDEEKSIIKLKTKIDFNMDRMPHGVLPPIIKSRSINSVPQMAITLWSRTYDGYGLRQIAGEVENSLKSIKEVAETAVIGGYKRVIRVEPDINKIKGYGLDLMRIYGALSMSNSSLNTGEMTSGGKVMYLTAGGFFRTPEDVKNLVVGAFGGKPIFLRDVAAVLDGPGDPHHYHLMGFNKARTLENFQAATITLSKRKGSDSVVVADNVLEKLHSLKGYVIPSDVQVTVTRDYGETAYDKVRTLIEHLLGAILAVMIVMTVAMGWRAGVVVFVALPVTFAMTFFVYYIFGYTLNRVTLFALIFVVGLVVDDAIIIVENMERHFKIARDNLFARAIYAVGEVGNPTILATITVIVAIYPMAFVSGLMGPYMKPMPIGASLAMLFSLFVALTITPWLAFKLLAGHAGKGGEEIDEDEWVKTTRLYKIYRRILLPLMEKWPLRALLLVVMLLLFIGAFLFVPAKMVVMKMLPFDNKNELQVIVDMPEGTTLERTTALAVDIGHYLSTVPEVENYQIFSGIAAPINFNGLVRHYFFRKGENVADIQVNFVDKSKRSRKSHELAKIMRGPIQEIGRKYNANIKIAEVPPGPPVLSTLVAQIYGPDQQERIRLATKVKKIFEDTDGVVDVDWYMEDDMEEIDFTVDKVKAALTGISTEMISKTLYMATSGMKVGILHTGKDREDVDIIVKIPEKQKSTLDVIRDITLISMAGKPVPLSAIVKIRKRVKDKTIYHENLKPVVYVIGDVAGTEESPVYAILKMRKKVAELTAGSAPVKQYWTRAPENTQVASVKWDGEWQITYEVFRDLGLAFAGAMIVMYFILVAWFGSFITPIIMMIPIPLSLLGIIPGHFIFGKFFTATSMIGFIALAGIMVRNAVLIIDFIEIGLDRGKQIKDAVIESGAIRTRPVVLTTVAVIVGAFFMLPDPIFAGLGVSLITGAAVSTVLTLVIIPLGYYMYYQMFHKSE